MLCKNVVVSGQPRSDQLNSLYNTFLSSGEQIQSVSPCNFVIIYFRIIATEKIYSWAYHYPICHKIVSGMRKTKKLVFAYQPYSFTLTLYFVSKH